MSAARIKAAAGMVWLPETDGDPAFAGHAGWWSPARFDHVTAGDHGGPGTWIVIGKMERWFPGVDVSAVLEAMDAAWRQRGGSS